MIHPTALISDRVVIGGNVHVGAYCILGDIEPGIIEKHNLVIEDNVFIGPMTRIQVGRKRDTVIGVWSNIAGQCLIGHDSIIGKRCTMHDCATIHGVVTLGDNVTLGVGARVRPGKIVGNNSYIGMGGIVVDDVPSDVVYAGVPARFLRDRKVRLISWWTIKLLKKKVMKWIR